MPLLLRWSVAFRAARADQEHLNEVDGGEMTCGESILELSERRFLQVGEVWVGHLAQKKRSRAIYVVVKQGEVARAVQGNLCCSCNMCFEAVIRVARLRIYTMASVRDSNVISLASTSGERLFCSVGLY